MNPSSDRPLQFVSLLLALAYPAIHFVTRLEDPTGYEPLWQYQIISLLFLAVFGASWTEVGKPYINKLYYAAAFSAGFWAMWAAYGGGYQGKRTGLFLLMVITATMIKHIWVLVAYSALMFGSVVVGVFLREPITPRAIVIGRVTVIAFLVLAMGGVRVLTSRRLARHEQKLRQIIWGCPMPCILIEHGRCLLANAAAHRLINIQPGDALRDTFGADDPWWSNPSAEGRVLTIAYGVDGQERQCEVTYACVDAAAGISQAIFIDKTLSTPSNEIKRLLISHINRRLRPHVIGLQQALHASANSPADALESATQLDRALDELVLSARVDATPPAADLSPSKSPANPDPNPSTSLWPSS